MREERVERAEIVAKHRKLESASQDALAATCGDAEAWSKQHCKPTCYPAEPKDGRAGAKVAGAVAIQHQVCQLADASEETSGFLVVDELDNAALKVQPFRKRFPKAHKKGTWQAGVAAWFFETQVKKLPKRDALIVSGTWRDVVHPVTKEALRCVTVAHYTTGVRGKLDACGMARGGACEANGDVAARAINLLHYRLAEAKALQSAGNEDGCADAAHAAVAVARGLPRWRQYKKLNVAEWTEGLAYKTRFDGVLDEDRLFAAAAALGEEAEQVYAACTGAPRASTTPEQEQSFHSCPAP